MIKPGRMSVASIATVTPMPVRTLQPPPDLGVDEAEVWERVVATRSVDWWDAGNIPLLEQYCRAVVQSRMLAGQVAAVGVKLAEGRDVIKTYKELRKMQSAISHEITTLARSMRLTQQAQYTKDKAGIASRGAGMRKPWTLDLFNTN